MFLNFFWVLNLVNFFTIPVVNHVKIVFNFSLENPNDEKGKSEQGMFFYNNKILFKTKL